MKTLSEIREDLKCIRYYYARKEMFDEAVKTVIRSSVIDKVAEYNDAMKTATPMLFDIYVSLYIKNNTQEALSIELNYTPEYIQMLNKKLLLFLQKRLSN